MQNYLTNFITGMVIGVAQILPAVSGASLALAMGVYYKLLDQLHNFFNLTFFVSTLVIKKANKQDVKLAFKQVDFKFLITITLGMLFAIVVLANLIDDLLSIQPQFINALFFGLALGAGVVILVKTEWNIFRAGVAIASAIITAVIIIMLPNLKITGLLAMVLAGLFTALGSLLPGLGGSFYLLILGQFDYIIKLVKGFTRFNLSANELLDLGVFILVAIVTVVVLVKVIKHAVTKYKDTLNAFMLGNVAAGLYALWPFVQFESDELIKVLPWQLPFLNVVVIVIVIAFTTFVAYSVGKRSAED